MIGLVNLIQQIAPGLYVFIAIGMVLMLRSLMMNRSLYRRTLFELERDIARYSQGNAVTGLVLLLETMLFVAGIQTVVAPTLQAVEAQQQNAAVIEVDEPFYTPTPQPLATFNIDTSGINLVPTDPSLNIRLTPIPTATQVGTIIPNAPTPVDCTSGNASLHIPANGQRVYQIIEVQGTASIDNFAFYRLELRGGPFPNYTVLLQSDQPVRERGYLGHFVPSSDYETGLYQFRLTVFDINGELKASCTSNIYITEPVPTPTPIGQ